MYYIGPVVNLGEENHRRGKEGENYRYFADLFDALLLQMPEALSRLIKI